jgi:NADPH-dependent 2,4-dienoyl-CoA reductase/sulfur reductase-like enzyme
MTNNLKVIIVGGGIAGLTLANALEVCLLRADDHVRTLFNTVYSEQISIMSSLSEGTT